VDAALAIAYTLFVWWFSTGAVLYLVGMPRHTFAVSMTTATAAAGLALFGLTVTAQDATVASAFCAFSCALVVWGWHEMSFLTATVTGPRRTACPPDADGWRRFSAATATLIHHEIAIVLTAGVIAALTWGAPNQLALWTFLVFWLARLSAKFNVFLGVPNLSESFLPTHLQYLASYFRHRSMNLLFPVSITALTAAAFAFGYLAATDATAFGTTAWTLLATLTALALAEHWFMVVPLPTEALWTWGLKSRTTGDPLVDAPNIVPLNRATRDPALRDDRSGGRHAV
jgi:putative photosynthetic complex assembly protein 2